MEPLTLIIGLLGIAFLLLYFIFNLDSEHVVFKLIGIVFFITTMVLVAKALVDNDQTCDIVLSSTNITSANYTEYTYTEFCVANDKQTTSILFKSITWFYRLFFLYMFIFVIWLSLNYLIGITKTKK